MRRIAFTAARTAQLVDQPDFSGPLKPLEVRGRTLITLTSPGTELNWGFLNTAGAPLPIYPGYASIFQIEAAGSEVRDLPAGTSVFSSGGHASQQQFLRQDVVPLPAGLAPETAVFARLAGVSMCTLNTTTARPPSRVLVTGLGPVGNLAAQVFAACGYQVTAVDPAKARREGAQRVGLKDVREAVPRPAESVNRFALHVECSGHEQAVLDGCKAVHKRGEVVLLGVPWSRKTELFSFDLLQAIFHGYVVLRSGWEWEVPGQPRDFSGNSMIENYRAALEWLAEGRLRVDGLASLYAPERAQEVYQGLLAQSLPTPAALFDWR
jgi:threonine dehydrogenase-like Zn-dependent dehydrogenase